MLERFTERKIERLVRNVYPSSAPPELPAAVRTYQCPTDSFDEAK